MKNNTTVKKKLVLKERINSVVDSIKIVFLDGKKICKDDRFENEKEQ